MFSFSSYFSTEYLVMLLPASVLLYALLPQRLRRWSLLLSSYVFFWAISGKLIAFLLFSTLSLHHFGIWLGRIQGELDGLLERSPREMRKELKRQYTRKQRLVVAFALALHLGILLRLKYTPFFASNINILLGLLGIERKVPIPSYVLHIGIS